MGACYHRGVMMPALLLLLANLAVQEEKPLFTQDDLLEILREAIPAVERATGRKFREPVWIRVSTRKEVERALADELVPQMAVLEPEADPGQAPESARKYATLYGEILIAKYAWKHGTIHLVPETFHKLAKVLEQPSLLDRAVLRVIVTHELVHALDAQEFGLFKSLGDVKSVTELEIRNALSEGHAQHVARRVFEATGELAAFEAYEKVILAGPPSLGETERYLAGVMTASLRLAYLDGRAFFDALRKSGPPTYVEDVFRNPPASKNVILKPERYYGGKDAADFDPTAAFDAFAGELGDEWNRRTQELDHATLRATFGEMIPADEVDAVLKGIEQGHILVLTPKKPPNSRMVAVAVLRGKDAEAAAKAREASVKLAKAKDKKFAGGPIKIAKADYGALAGIEGIDHVLFRKTLEVGEQSLTISSVIGSAGAFEFEILFNNEEADDARLASLVRRLAEALRAK